MASHLVVEEDVISVISCLTYLLVVRREGEIYRLIALAYVHDLMDRQRWQKDTRAAPDLANPISFAWTSWAGVHSFGRSCLLHPMWGNQRSGPFSWILHLIIHKSSSIR